MEQIKAPVPIEKMLDNWAIISVDKFQESLVKLNIGEVDGQLMRSFMHEVKKSGDNGFSVIIKFIQYGRFFRYGRKSWS